MQPRHLLLCLAVAAALAACNREQPRAAPAAPRLRRRSRHAAATAHAFGNDINAGDFAELVKTLSSDAFEGRGPGTPGEDKSVDYIKAQFERIGLKPGNDGDMVPGRADDRDHRRSKRPRCKLDVDGKPEELKFGTDMVIGTRTGQPEVKVQDSPLVFVGYGVDAPEQQWNDYAGIDVKGKTVVMLVNDPGFHADDATLFEGKRMTYYGRWTYKFEEAARKGAAAALIIHDTPGASYGWDVVKNSWSGAQYDLRAADDPAPRVPAQGWITGEAAKTLFADAGLDLDAMYKAAGKRGFKAVPMKAKLSFDLKSTITEKSSRNVIGMLPGSEKPGRSHGLHGALGPPRQARRRAEPGDDIIYNGAVDNATGVAGIIEIAEAVREADAGAEALAGVRRGHAGGIRPARLAVLRRASGDPARQDRRRDQHRCDGRRRQGRTTWSWSARATRELEDMLKSVDRQAGPHAGGGKHAAERLLLPLRPLQLRQGRRAGAVHRKRRRPGRRRQGRGRGGGQGLQRPTATTSRPTSSTPAGSSTAWSRTCRRCTASAACWSTATAGRTGIPGNAFRAARDKMMAGQKPAK